MEENKKLLLTSVAAICVAVIGGVANMLRSEGVYSGRAIFARILVSVFLAACCLVTCNYLATGWHKAFLSSAFCGWVGYPIMDYVELVIKKRAKRIVKGE